MEKVCESLCLFPDADTPVRIALIRRHGVSSMGLPTEETTAHILELLKPVYVKGLTLIGGEPMEPENQAVLLKLVQAVRHTFGTQKDIWCYTGCVLESELLSESPYRCDVTDALLSEIDVLVDGPFIEEEKSLQLAFRGSMNQRILRKQNGRFVVSET